MAACPAGFRPFPGDRVQPGRLRPDLRLGGHWLDERYGTEPRYFLIGAALGLLAAGYHFYKMYKTMTGGKR